MTIDFCRSLHRGLQTVIQNKVVETVDEYKFIKPLMTRKLSFESKREAVCKKGPTETFLFEEDEVI